ncbi:MAG: DUF3987 domain-containing protein [Nitrospira sp.]|nr:DUF3987 domain-containing protein [Nitrospira sp.]
MNAASILETCLPVIANNDSQGIDLNAESVRDAARGRWRDILGRLGIAVPPTPMQHGPCPECGGKDRFRFDDLDGRGTWYCNQCVPKAGDGIALVQNIFDCEFREALELVADEIGYHSPKGNQKPRIVATYDYTDKAGKLLFQVVRFEPKDFRQRHPDGHSGWIWNLKGIEPVLYKLPQLTMASSVLIVEGEKDVETAFQLGLPEGWAATCNPMGAGKWKDAYSETLTGKHVVILPDADEPGAQHGLCIAQALKNEAASVSQLTLPEGIKDLSVWATNQTTDSFRALLSTAQPWDSMPSAVNPIVPSAPRGARPERWPELDSAALHGLAGEVVQTIGPHTEADLVAILVQLLVAFGNCLNRAPHFLAEADRHGMNLNAVLVGETAKGRKGTSWGHVRRIFQSVDCDWVSTRILNGLSSGEGLIWAVRDEITKDEPLREGGRVTGEFQTVVTDRGVTDKRLLVLESEFAGTLRVMGRDGNTLSAIVRQAWDSGNLRTMTKNSPAQATEAHISIIAHITKDELCRLLDATEASNGFCNRFLWVCVKRSKMLPEGGNLSDSALDPLARRLSEAVQFGRGMGKIERDEAARAQWREVYPALSEGKPGLLGGVVSRAEAQVMRLACLYALLDRSYVVTPVHLRAALAVWEYCEASTQYIFGHRLGDPIADGLLSALRQHPQGMTKTEIRDWFGRNRKASEIDRGLAVLANQELARTVEVRSSGRPIERWLAMAGTTT